MTLSLEVGKFYRADNGDKVGPLIDYGGLFVTHDRGVHGGYLWHPNGAEAAGRMTLVAEWTDEEQPREHWSKRYTGPIGVEKLYCPNCGFVNPGECHATEGHHCVPKPVNPMQALLDEAASAVVARGKRYGEPEDNWKRIARRWSVHMLNRYGIDLNLDEVDVASMMIDVKQARLENDPTHRDSWVDIAGYAAGGGTAKKAIDTPS